MDEEQILKTFGLEPGDLDGPEFADYRRARAEADAAMAAFAETLQQRCDEIASKLEAELRQKGVLSGSDRVTISVTLDR